MTNIKLEAMITKIREILSGKGLTERDFDEATKELLDLYDVSKLFDDKINEINHQLNVSGFEGYHEFRKAQDEVRSLEVAKRVLNVC